MLRVQHANILNLFGWTTDPNCVYIVMEFMPFSLRKILETTLPEYDYDPLMKSKRSNSSQLLPQDDDDGDSRNSTPQSPQSSVTPGLVGQRTKKLLGTGLKKGSKEDLTSEIERYNKFLQRQPILSNEMKLQIAIDIAEGMNHLHSRPKPIIHRDLKSHNVLLDKNLVSKISDFGFASMRNRNSGVSGMKGTSGWMAPEMFSSAASSGEKADVYSFGMVIYELVTHLIPFHDVPNPFTVASQVIMGARPSLLKPEELAKSSPIISCFIHLIQSCCEQEPDARPTFSQILHELRGIPLDNSLEYTVDLYGKGDHDTIQGAINALPLDITKIKPKRPVPTLQNSLTKTYSASSLIRPRSSSDSQELSKSLTHRDSTPNYLDTVIDSKSKSFLQKANSFKSNNSPSSEYDDVNNVDSDSEDDHHHSSRGVMLGTNNPISDHERLVDFSEVEKNRLLMQKFDLPYVTRPTDGRKIIKPTRPLTTPIIKINPGIYREKITIDRGVILQGVSEGKSHVILYKPKDADDVIIFDNVRYAKMRNIIVYNPEHKPQGKTVVSAKPPCFVKLQGSKCDSAIENCTFKGVTLVVCDGADPTITGNTIRDSTLKGIHIHSGAHGTFAENDIFGSLEANILIEDGANPVIENNQIHNGLSEGIKITEGGLGNIVNNKIFSNHGSNVYIGAHADPLIMLNKLFTSENRGIEAAAFAKGKCRKNRLCGNKVEPQIYTVGLSKTILKDNQILALPNASPQSSPVVQTNAKPKTTAPQQSQTLNVPKIGMPKIVNPSTTTNSTKNLTIPPSTTSKNSSANTGRTSPLVVKSSQPLSVKSSVTTNK